MPTKRVCIILSIIFLGIIILFFPHLSQMQDMSHVTTAIFMEIYDVEENPISVIDIEKIH